VLIGVLACPLAALTLLLALAWRWRHAPVAPDHPPRWSAQDSPFANVRGQVQYTGDAACAACHEGHAESYRAHPMGRSLAAAARARPLERYGPDANPVFERIGFRFAAEQVGDRMVQRAQRLDAGGRVLAEAVYDVAFSVGSGTRGRSYLVERDGSLLQTPVSWYAEKNGWDLSPGFTRVYPPDRAVEPVCLFCHANRVEPVAGTRNRYRPPTFRGESIGCERCHGPGALHVASRERGDVPTGAFDDTIVNPRHLPPALREAVCQQCHLQGAKRVVRRGHDVFDYRPGLPLHEFWAVFVRKPEFQDNRTSVGQVEQMYHSRCFQASAGRMGCISCHDPHAVPAADQKTAHYRRRCLNCHEEGSPAGDGPAAARACALAPAVRRQQNREDSCIACHMPRAPSSNIVHTAITDHRILRHPAPYHSPRALRPGDVPIVNFLERELGLHDADSDRDLGMALVLSATNDPLARQILIPPGVPYLERAVRDAPDDADAWEALGWAYSVVGRLDEARSALAAVLRLVPEHEKALSLAAQVAERLGRLDDAIAFRRRAKAVNPWLWEHRSDLALLLARRQDWRAAREEAEAALPLNPADQAVRQVLITCRLRTGDAEGARKEFETLVALFPDQAASLRRWFEEQAP
jgi:predicted CXXCH cytochrome family protein